EIECFIHPHPTRGTIGCTNMILLHNKCMNRTSSAESARFRAVFAHFLLVISDFAQGDAKATVGHAREGILCVLTRCKKACTSASCRLDILQNSSNRHEHESEENSKELHHFRQRIEHGSSSGS
ncbi:hypothetical protein PENTCL1PPCAC_4169, partial [Pristionchus entomophagus]